MKTTQITITKAKPEDLSIIRKILESTDLPFEGVQANIRNFILAQDDSKETIGVAGIEVYGRDGLLRSVAIVSAHRGEGIGQLLVRECIAEAKKSGIQDLYLLTDTAEKFMERFGFKRIDRKLVHSSLQASEEFKGACTETATAMLLEL